MWDKIKRYYNRMSLFLIAILLVGFLVFTTFTLFFKSAEGNLDSLTAISIIAVIISFPGMATTFANEINPQKKTYKLSCRCPKCKHLIRMDMKEE